MYCILFYDYCENVIERRAPFREAHLKLAQEWAGRGELILGGAVGDPIDGGVLVFKVDDLARVEEFVRVDPYVAGGVATAWRIRPWTVVVGSAM
jgi:uncharacterized protein